LHKNRRLLSLPLSPVNSQVAMAGHGVDRRCSTAERPGQLPRGRRANADLTDNPGVPRWAHTSSTADVHAPLPPHPAVHRSVAAITSVFAQKRVKRKTALLSRAHQAVPHRGRAGRAGDRVPAAACRVANSYPLYFVFSRSPRSSRHSQLSKTLIGVGSARGAARGDRPSGDAVGWWCRCGHAARAAQRAVRGTLE